MKTVSEILGEKRKDPTTIGPRRPVIEALRLMIDTDVGAVMVVDGSTLVGVVSERDYVRRVVQGGIASETPVQEVMTTNPVAVTPEWAAERCMVLMVQKHVRHLPVLHEGTLVGVVSIRDVVKAALDEKEFLIDQLEGYIAGR